MTFRLSRADRLARRIVLLAILLDLCVSANLLTWMGVPYVTAGGSFLLKLHPSSYLLLSAFLLCCAGDSVRQTFAVQPLLLAFLISICVSLVYLLTLTGTGNIIVLLDTFLPAGLLAAVTSRASLTQLQHLRSVLQFFIALNAALALGEVAFHGTLIPLYLNDSAYEPHMEDFRPTALYDHPLTGAVMTLLGLALPPTEGHRRSIYILLLWAALVAFGGRTAMVAALVSTIIMVVLQAGKLLLLRDNRKIIALFLAVAAGSLAAVTLGALAMYAGLGSRLAGHLYWDSSAQVRLAQWQVLDHLDMWQLTFGTRREDLLAVLTLLRQGPGVEVIENFWLLMFVAFGVAGTPLFLAGLFALLLWCWKRTDLRGRLLIAAVMLVASTSNSLGRKSSILVCLVATVLCRPRELELGTKQAHWTRYFHQRSVTGLEVPA